MRQFADFAAQFAIFVVTLKQTSKTRGCQTPHLPSRKISIALSYPRGRSGHSFGFYADAVFADLFIISLAFLDGYPEQFGLNTAQQQLHQASGNQHDK